MGRALRAAGRAAGTLIALAVVAWACQEAAPGDVRERAARAAGLLPAESDRVSPEVRARAVAAAGEARGVAATPAARLGTALAGLARADLGRSWRDGGAVRARVASALPATLALVGLAAALAVLLGLAAGLGGARRPGGRADRVLGAAAAVALAVPVAWLAVLALRVFAWGHPWRVAPTHGGLVLPALCLALATAAAAARLARARLGDPALAPLRQAALARGASSWRALVVHALGAAAAPLVAFVPALVGWLLAAAPVVERAFDRPGAGALLLDAAAAGDAPVVTGVVLAFGAVVGVTAIVCEAVAAKLAPRAAAEDA